MTAQQIRMGWSEGFVLDNLFHVCMLFGGAYILLAAFSRLRPLKKIPRDFWGTHNFEAHPTGQRLFGN